MKRDGGFTLVEMLVSLLIFLFVILGIYFLFNQGQWLFLAGEKKADIQENARILTSGLENDFRMIGYGVPKGASVDSSVTSRWSPAIFSADSTSIGFCGDIDGGSTILAEDVGTGGNNNRIYVDDPSYFTGKTSGGSSVDTVLSVSGKKWDAVTVTGVVTDTPFNYLSTSADVLSPATFTAQRSAIYTLESVSYRFTGDNDGDGICDAATTSPYLPTGCTIDRAEFIASDPDHRTPAGSDWAPVASNIYTFKIRYFNQAGTELTAFPLSAADRDAVVRILILITVRSRAQGAGQFQDINMKSEILVRNKAL